MKKRSNYKSILNKRGVKGDDNISAFSYYYYINARFKFVVVFNWPVLICFTLECASVVWCGSASIWRDMLDLFFSCPDKKIGHKYR